MWSDKETIEDCLGFQAYVEALKRVVLMKDITPVTVGVFGDWGAGKTSLMKLLEADLSTKEMEKAGIVTIWFNPWQYENKDEVQTAFIQTILEDLKRKMTILDEATTFYQDLVKNASVFKLAKCLMKTEVNLSPLGVEIKPDMDGFFDAFSSAENRLSTTMREFNEKFQSFLQAQQIKHLVVFIDDLDRCQPDKAFDLFETIQLFLASERCAFVIGADPEKILAAVRHRYGQSSAGDSLSRDYVEKVIQIPFRIPFQSSADIALYINTLLLLPHIKESDRAEFRRVLLSARGNKQDIAEAALQWATTNTSKLDSDISVLKSEIDLINPHLKTIVSGLKGNPRQIKRFLNIYKLRKALSETNQLNIVDALLIKLLIMEYSWPDQFKSIFAVYDQETGHSPVLDGLLEAIASTTQADTDSLLVEELLSIPGLKDFILSEPSFDNINLNPYMFLAQTSLEKQSGQAILPSKQLLVEIVHDIISGDKVRAKIATLKAKELDSESIRSAIEAAIPSIFNDNNMVAVHTANGIHGLLKLSPESAEFVIEVISQNTKPLSAQQKMSILTLLNEITLLDRASSQAKTNAKELAKSMRPTITRGGAR